MDTFDFDPHEQETELSTVNAPEVELSGFISLPEAVVPEVHPDYAAVRYQGALDERAVMELWRRRTEVVLFLLSRLDNEHSNLELIRAKFDEMIIEVFPSSSPRLDPEDLRSRFEEALGLHSGVDPRASTSEVPACVDADRRCLNLAFQRMVYLSQTVTLGSAERPWSFVEARCLRVIAPLVERLGRADVFEQILADPEHHRFELALGVARDIAENTSPLAGPGALDPSREEQMNMRRRLAGHLTHALLRGENLERADKILTVLGAFDLEALPALEYLLDSSELDPRLNCKVWNEQTKIAQRALHATQVANGDFIIQGHDPKLFAI